MGMYGVINNNYNSLDRQQTVIRNLSLLRMVAVEFWLLVADSDRLINRIFFLVLCSRWGQSDIHLRQIIFKISLIKRLSLCMFLMAS